VGLYHAWGSCTALVVVLDAESARIASNATMYLDAGTGEEEWALDLQKCRPRQTSLHSVTLAGKFSRVGRQFDECHCFWTYTGSEEHQSKRPSRVSYTQCQDCRIACKQRQRRTRPTVVFRSPALYSVAFHSAVGNAIEDQRVLGKSRANWR
jgi:hypothetical protein